MARRNLSIVVALLLALSFLAPAAGADHLDEEEHLDRPDSAKGNLPGCRI